MDIQHSLHSNLKTKLLILALAVHAAFAPFRFFVANGRLKKTARKSGPHVSEPRDARFPPTTRQQCAKPHAVSS